MGWHSLSVDYTNGCSDEVAQATGCIDVQDPNR
jgi:hypothetical protein